MKASDVKCDQNNVYTIKGSEGFYVAESVRFGFLPCNRSVSLKKLMFIFEDGVGTYKVRIARAAPFGEEITSSPQDMIDTGKTISEIVNCLANHPLLRVKKINQLILDKLKNGVIPNLIQYSILVMAGTLQFPSEPTPAPNVITASGILKQGVEALSDRAESRDTENERSMTACVAAFNAMYGKDLTVEQGWMFQVFLKASRAKGGAFREDDYVDGASYFALAGEETQKERG